MKIISAIDLPKNDVIYTFRESRSVNFFFSSVIVCLIIFLLVLIRPGLSSDVLANFSTISIIVFWGVIIALFIFFIITAKTLYASFKKENWLLKLSRSGLYVKFRSYLNHKLSDPENCIIYIPSEEIISVYPVRLRKPVADTSPDKISGSYWFFMDIALNHKETSLLKEALMKEKSPQLKHLRAIDHFPVSLFAPNIIRLEWDFYKTHTKPGIDKAINILKPYIKVDSEITIPTKHIEEYEKEMLNKELITKAIAGNRLQAINDAKIKLGFNTTRASIYIDELIKKSQNDLASNIRHN
jgi:hypothetical protein